MTTKIKKTAGVVLFGLLAVSFTFCSNAPKDDKQAAKNETKSEVVKDNAIKHLDAESFKAEVFDYVNSKEWSYKGDKPAILDFYADWCGPCKMLAPHLEAMQKEYNGAIQVYKINTDEQRELAGAFGIQSLPTIVFVPKDGQPQAVMGYREQADLEKMVTEVLKVVKPE